MSNIHDDREWVRNTDGTSYLTNPNDKVSEQAIADQLARAWGLDVHLYKSTLCPLDGYIVKDERVVAVLEIKRCARTSTRYRTVVLSLRKWLALTLAGIGQGIRGVYVVHFEDRTMSIDVAKIPPGLRMGGRIRPHGGHNDREPMLDVPIELMDEVGR